MPDYELTCDARGVATLRLDRPDRHNAFDDRLIADLIQLFAEIKQDPKLRILLLTATGKSFSAGADLSWMRRTADYEQARNQRDAMELATLMRSLNQLPMPTIARVQGAAYGGGVGLVACCDIAIASDAAEFCLSEVKLGLIPAVISPYLINAIGQAAARRYLLSAERFDARRAAQLGLLHEVVTADELDSRVEQLIERLLVCGPAAQAAAKKLILELGNKTIDQSLVEDTANRIANIRASAEAREGLNAFLEKRRPNWIESD